LDFSKLNSGQLELHEVRGARGLLPVLHLLFYSF
jgi:hypothetical protein